MTAFWAQSKGTDTTGNNVSAYPTIDSTALLEKLNMIFDSHLDILYTREPDHTCVRSKQCLLLTPKLDRPRLQGSF